MFRRTLSSLLVVSAVCTAAPAFAATVSGKISDTGATGLAGMEVRLWTNGGKGYVIDQLVISGADGTYSFGSVAAGTYKLDARMAPMVGGNFGDRWYDVAAPMANGYVQADADEIAIADADVLTGMNIELEALGGLDVRVLAGATPVQGLRIRAELKSDERVHHNDATDGPCCGTNPHLGRSYFRGMVPGNYRFIAYDPSGLYRTTVFPGPYTVTQGADADSGDITIQTMISDPSEPNNASSDAGTPTIDPATFPFLPQNASISPAGDVDYFCINASAGERYKAQVTSILTVEGVERRHPWFDPMIGLWDGSAVVLSNDDVTPGVTWDSVLDTGALPSDGRWCFLVTTFGDTNFVGGGQLSVGEYQIEIGYGNRQPTLAVIYEGVDVPVAPTEIMVDEDVLMNFEMLFTDPDGDLLNVEVRHFDNASVPVATGNLARAADTATYSWTPSQQDAALSPFELTFRVTDAEYDLRIPVIVRVGAVSVPPTVPIPIEPANGATVETADVTLVVTNSTDADGDSLTYDFQVEVGEPDNMPEFEATEAEDASGMTSTPLTALEENAQVSWRARAFDGADYSAWSDWSLFLVDAQNDPPDAPSIIKPTQNETVEERQPTLASTVPADPEGEAVTVLIEVASDSGFNDIVASSGDVAPTTDDMMISWLIEDPLDFGGIYYARASATDERGATSAYSEVVPFAIRFEREIVAPSFSADFALCEPRTLDSLPTEVVVLQVDDSGDTVTFEVQISPAETPEEPVVQAAAPQSTEIETIVSLDVAEIVAPAGAYLLRVRAVRGLSEATEWTACPFNLTGEDVTGPTDEGTEDDGCGCGTASGGPSGLLLVFGLLAIVRRRRHRNEKAA